MVQLSFCCGMDYLYFQLVKVVNNHTNDEVKDEESAKNNENHKVQIRAKVTLSTGLMVDLKTTKKPQKNRYFNKL
jgi:hypothetical protein